MQSREPAAPSKRSPTAYVIFNLLGGMVVAAVVAWIMHPILDEPWWLLFVGGTALIAAWDLLVLAIRRRSQRRTIANT